MMSTSLSGDDAVTPRASRAHLDRMLEQLIDHPEREAEITRVIGETFGQDKAVMVLDMSGFSRTTHELGIVPFLSMIHRMRRLAVPCVEAARGQLLKAEADNLFCLFETVDAAVDAARQIVERLNAANTDVPEERRLYASIGIGYGRLLNIEGHDVFGDEVNLASKLGEDIGERGEVLLTARAREQVRRPSVALRERSVSVSGLTLSFYRVLE